MFCILLPTGILRLPWLRVFPYFFLNFKANARVYLAKTGHGPHSSQLVNCVVLCIVFLCKRVLYYFHRVSTQLQLNISYVLSLHAKCLVFSSDFHRIWIFSTHCRKSHPTPQPSIEINCNTGPGRSRVDIWGQMDRRTDTMKLTAAFRDLHERSWECKVFPVQRQEREKV